MPNDSRLSGIVSGGTIHEVPYGHKLRREPYPNSKGRCLIISDQSQQAIILPGIGLGKGM